MMHAWFEERLGLRALMRAVLEKPVGAHVGWSQTLGSVACFLFFLQAATGVVLALYYVPTPSDAFAAVTAIHTEVTLGWLLRSIHRWGASLMVLAVILHLARSFIHGAYKPPREATWIAGVGLLVLTLAFGYTGYLLPWDQRAYWATTVGMWIMASIPIAGPLLVRALGGLEVGGATLSRFFILHILLLPGATFLLLVLHLYLVQRHGVAGPPGESPGPFKPFYPFHAAKDLAACLMAFAILLVLAVWLGAPIDAPANPTDTTYLPKPEWYFLFLYEVLKFFAGRAMVVGTTLLPLAGLLVLAALPFIDRSEERRPLHRPLALASGIALAGGLLYLTVVGETSTPKPGVFLSPAGSLSPKMLAGIALFDEKGCQSCHSIQGIGMKLAPDLYRVGAKRDAEWLSRLLTDPKSVFPSPGMVKYTLVPEDLDALVGYLAHLDPSRDLQSLPRATVVGGAAIYRHGCLACHLAGGEGKKLGVALEEIKRKRDEKWLARYLEESRGHLPLPFPLTSQEVPAVVTYIQSLRK
jgi:ubiquinol-cytochrome c reductase cytochrome b subunit